MIPTIKGYGNQVLGDLRKVCLGPQTSKSVSWGLAGGNTDGLGIGPAVPPNVKPRKNNVCGLLFPIPLFLNLWFNVPLQKFSRLQKAVFFLIIVRTVFYAMIALY